MKSLLLSLAIATAASPVLGAEIRLLESATVDSGLVRLGDVADVTGPGAAQLVNLPLMPAPSEGATRRLSAGAIRDLLKAQGVAPGAHRFRGAYHVRIGLGVNAPVAAPAPAPAPAPEASSATEVERPAAAPSTTAFRVRPAADRGSRWSAIEARSRTITNPRQVERGVADRLQEALNLRTDAASPAPRLLVRSVTISATAARELGQFDPSAYEAQLLGAESPAPGTVSALVWPASRGADEGFRVVAELVEQPMRVVATQPLPRGAVVVRSAVRLEPVPLEEINRPAALGYASLDQAVGTEALRAVRAGDVLSAINTSPPFVVHEGEEVDVFSGGGGVSVQLTAIAKGDGRLGDLVEVEAYDGQEAFSARVVGRGRLAVLSAGSSIAGVVRGGEIQ